MLLAHGPFRPSGGVSLIDEETGYGFSYAPHEVSPKPGMRVSMKYAPERSERFGEGIIIAVEKTGEQFGDRIHVLWSVPPFRTTGPTPGPSMVYDNPIDDWMHDD